MKKTQWVKIKTCFQALHQWSECPIKEVEFLKNKHHHMIYVTVMIETSEDRQVEFFMLKMRVDDIIEHLYGRQRIKDLRTRSMETISDEIFRFLKQTFPETNIKIEVSEDEQNSAVCEYET